MSPLPVECLRCGEQHHLHDRPGGRLQSGECPRCGYVGWALAELMTERARGALRDRPLELRLLYAVPPSSERAA